MLREASPTSKIEELLCLVPKRVRIIRKGALRNTLVIKVVYCQGNLILKLIISNKLGLEFLKIF